MHTIKLTRSIWLPVFVLCFLSFNVGAEPYLAIKSGLNCSSCHVSPTGGGMRTEFGQAYGLTLAGEGASEAKISGQISKYIRLGSDIRGSFRAENSDDEDSRNEFDTEASSIYIHAELVPGTLAMLIDQQIAPANDNRAVWLKLSLQDDEQYIRAGKFFLPYGIRLPDDTAFIRQVSGINFSSADDGIEYGVEKESWNFQIALSNGNAGAAELDRDKQLSTRLVYVEPDWRLGVSLNSNSSDQGDRDMLSLFGGFNALESQWLIEVDRIVDDLSDEITQQVSYFEVSYPLASQHNLKLRLESHDPNTSVSEDDRVRNSVIWEYFPMQLVQLTTGLRVSEGIPQKSRDNRDELFVRLHAWF